MFSHKHHYLFCEECNKIYNQGRAFGPKVNEIQQEKLFRALRKIERLAFENRVMKQALKINCEESRNA